MRPALFFCPLHVTASWAGADDRGLDRRRHHTGRGAPACQRMRATVASQLAPWKGCTVKRAQASPSRQRTLTSIASGRERGT